MSEEVAEGNQEREPTYKDYVMGAQVMRSVQTNVKVAMAFIEGNYDFVTKVAIYYKDNEEIPTLEQMEANSDKLEGVLGGIKDVVSKTLNESIQEAERIDVSNIPRNEKLKRRYDDNSQHPAGSTKEIAEKYGWGIKQVRRMKKEGTLDQHIREQEQTNGE